MVQTISTASATPLVSQLTGEGISIEKLQLKKWQPDPWSLRDGAVDHKPSTPSEWFSRKFPEQASIHGTPFLEMVEKRTDGLSKINPLSANLDFLAAILGGDKAMGHDVVYIEGEMQWFYHDPRSQLYKPTSDAKLGNLLRALLIRCAEEMPESVNKFSLFQEFRSDKTIRAVVHRAKSILAADHTFFSSESNKVRQKGPEVHERLARVFAEQVLERQAGEVLTLTNAYVVFTEFLKQRSMPPVKRPVFKDMLAPIVRDVFNLGLRNDVIDQGSQHQTAGWKNLRTVDLQA